MSNLNLEAKIEKLSAELKNLKSEQQRRVKKAQVFFKYSLGAFLITGSMYAFAAAISSLHIFSAGEVISAQKINENFAYLENKINSMATGGGAGGSVFIGSYQELNISEVDNKKLFVVEKAAKFILPSASTMPAGFSLKFTLNPQAQAQLIVASGDSYDYYVEPLIVIGSSNSDSAGYLELLANGNQWVPIIQNTVSSSGLYPAQISAEVCRGKGSGSINCYENPTAKSDGYVKIDERIFRYISGASSGTWEQVGTYDSILIYDPQSALPGSYEFGSTNGFQDTQVVNEGGITYVLSSYNDSIYYATQNLGTYYSDHAGANSEDYLNLQIEGNLYDSVNDKSIAGYGTCKHLFGKDWKHITASQVGSISTQPFSYWTASATAIPNEYQYFDSSLPGLSTITASGANYFRMLCVYSP